MSRIIIEQSRLNLTYATSSATNGRGPEPTRFLDDDSDYTPTPVIGFGSQLPEREPLTWEGDQA